MVTSSPLVFLFLTVLLFGFAAVMTGITLATNWRPWWHVLGYTVILGLVDRFLVFALFDGQLFSVAGFAIDTAVLELVALLAFRLTRVRRMVNQYPWRYQRQRLLFWSNKDEGKTI